MALISKENIGHKTTLGLWKRDEPLDLLESVYLLNSEEKTEYQKITNESRKKEWLTTRILLTELLECRRTILYNNYRKPFIENHTSNITISHSRNFVAIILSNFFTPGIDIETISERVEKVKHKFLNNEELQWCKKLNQLTACWSAKEAVFKIYQKELDFHDMIIAPFELTESKALINLSVIKKGKLGEFLVNVEQIESDILTYTLSNYSTE